MHVRHNPPFQKERVGTDSQGRSEAFVGTLVECALLRDSLNDIGKIDSAALSLPIPLPALCNCATLNRDLYFVTSVINAWCKDGRQMPHAAEHAVHFRENEFYRRARWANRRLLFESCFSKELLGQKRTFRFVHGVHPRLPASRHTWRVGQKNSLRSSPAVGKCAQSHFVSPLRSAAHHRFPCGL